MKSKVLISLLIAIWSTGALANNDWGENFSWSVECDEGARYYTYGPDRIWIYGEDKQNEDGTPLYPLLGVYISLANNATFAEAYLEWEDANGNIQKDNLEILDRGRIRGADSFIGERGCLWLGNDKCTLQYEYDDDFNVPCVKMHKNCKNTVVIKSTTREIVPTTIHFNYYSIINGHPLDYYSDGENYLASLSKSVVVKAHRTIYDEVESFSYEDPLLFFCDLDSVFTKVLDWDYDDNEHDTSGLVYELTFEIDGGDYNTNTKATFSPNAIYGPGEYNVDVSNVFSEEDAIYCWNTNFQFDLDGGGTIEYTLDGEQVPFSVNGEGLQGRCHESYFPIGITPKIIPNPGKVLESVTALYDSGISNEIEEESIPFTFNEEGGYYEIGNLAYSQETMFSAEDGVLWLGPGWMNTIKVRFKDDNTTTINFISDYSAIVDKYSPYDDTEWNKYCLGAEIKIGDHFFILDGDSTTFSAQFNWDNISSVFLHPAYKEESSLGKLSCTFSQDEITGPGIYDVIVSYSLSDSYPGNLWGTNFQFDLDGGGTVDYTLDAGEGPYSVSGEGIKGQYHWHSYPLQIFPIFKPNQGKVLESVTLRVNNGPDYDIQEIPISFTYNDAEGYYEIVDANGYDFGKEDGLTVDPSQMSTFIVRFKNVISVKANDYTRVYGEENPDFEYTVEDGELTGTPVITCDATPESPVGTYDIVISKGSVENNNVVFEKGTLTIEKAPLTIEAGEYEINQGDALPEFEPNYIGFKNGEMFNVLTRLPVFTCPYIPSDGPGTYTISVDGAEADNYEMTYVDGTLRVKEAPAPNNTLSSETVEIRTGGDGHISLELNNEDSIIMVEFYMQLPEGISLAKDEDGYWDATLNTNRSNRHSLEVEKNSEGLYHFLVYSTRNNALKGNDGELININIVCDENMEAGIYQATLRNILFNDIDKKEIVLPDYTFSLDVKDVLLGDVNGDWKINGSDIVLMVDHIMGRPSDSFIIAAAELTGDGQINGSDLVEEISLVMSQSISTNATSGTSNAPRYLATGLTMDAGSNGEAVLGVTNNGSFILAQMMLQLSEGQQLTDITTDSRHHVEYRQLADDRYFVLCYSGNNDEFISKDEMLTFHVTGEGSVSVSEAMLIDADRQECYFAPVSTGEATLIERVSYSLSQPADIYSVSGAMVRKQATSLKGLAKGVYFINGNKIIID